MRRTKEDTEKTRESILEAATELFATKGYTKTTLGNVAQKAGVTRGAVYWHFKNKLDVFGALYDRLHTPIFEIIMEGVTPGHPDLSVQIRQLCINLLLNVERDMQQRRTLAMFMTKCDFSGELEEYGKRHEEQKQKSMEMFYKHVRSAQEQGFLTSKVDADVIGFAVGGCLKGIITEYLEMPNKFDMKKQAPYLVDIIFKGIEAL